jgi:hypothetical protein
MSSDGVFTVSLDFELFWGMRDKLSLEEYGENLLGVQQAIPKMLDLFSKAGIHATWATVGFLFCRNTDDLRQQLPATLPNYSDPNLSPYRYLDAAGKLDPLYHFAPELIDRISQVPGQEVGTHTFCHYYCLEAGQSKDAFRDDLACAARVAARQGVTLRSLVFPRNQWNPEYLSLLNTVGIRCFRGNESSWVYKASDAQGQRPLRRAVRLLDSYFNLTGHHTYPLKACIANTPFNFPSSRFLRPYSRRLASLDGLRLRRIKRAMDDAAQHQRIYHLWWHPHNFGSNIDHNIAFMSRIAEHYVTLRQRHGMQSLNMGELANLGAVGD